MTSLRAGGGAMYQRLHFATGAASQDPAAYCLATIAGWAPEGYYLVPCATYEQGADQRHHDERLQYEHGPLVGHCISSYGFGLAVDLEPVL